MKSIEQTQLLRENLRVLVRKLGVLERGEASCCGITLSQRYTIVEIGRAGRMPVNKLIEVLGVDKSTVSKSVEKLVKIGIMVRENDSEDRRSIILHLSDQGQTLFKEIERRATAYFEEVVVEIPDDQREQIIEGLQYLTQALKTSRCC
ncbi:MAG: transcriptional regulator, MarR family [Firmicutes bacterium]|nr:transcriptional regulator, MarR family [Bacillota bacterium]